VRTSLETWKIARDSALRDAAMCAERGLDNPRMAYLLEAAGYEKEIKKMETAGNNGEALEKERREA
jgi:hypothetical protein